MYIVTGKTGTAHVSGLDDGAFNRGVIGAGDWILPNTTLTCTQTSAGVFQLSQADICMDGCVGRIEGTETVTMATGSQGMYRVDSIVATYSRATDGTGIESMAISIVTGTPSSTESGAVHPDLNTGSIYGGDTARQMRLFDISIYENTVNSIECAANYSNTLSASASGITEKWTGSISVPTNTWTLLDSMDVTNGINVLIGAGQWERNSEGYRQMFLSTSGTAPTGASRGTNGTAANETGVTPLEVMDVKSITEGKIYLYGFQTSGDSIKVSTFIKAVVV